MERFHLLLTGVMSGLVSLLAHAVLWSLAEMVRPRLRVASASVRQLDVPDILLHLVAGLGLAWLFWLSWGLAALVDVTWWERGLMFGGCACIALTTPAVISVARAKNVGLAPVLLIASRWATTCLIAGLACSWRWEHSAY